jgi:thioredoxin 1
MATKATATTFEDEVLQFDGKVIVDFWAEWCGPCHAVAPVLDRIADEHQVKLVKVNIDKEQDLAQRYGVASIPFMVLIENGQRLGTFDVAESATSATSGRNRARNAGSRLSHS